MLQDTSPLVILKDQGYYHFPITYILNGISDVHLTYGSWENYKNYLTALLLQINTVFNYDDISSTILYNYCLLTIFNNNFIDATTNILDELYTNITKIIPEEDMPQEITYLYNAMILLLMHLLTINATRNDNDVIFGLSQKLTMEWNEILNFDLYEARHT